MEITNQMDAQEIINLVEKELDEKYRIKEEENMTKYYFAGKFISRNIYLEKGMRLNWSTKIPIFFMKILPDILWKKDKIN